MQARAAVDWVDATRWKKTSPRERLRLLRAVRRNIDRHFDELVAVNCEEKGFRAGVAADAQQEGTATQSTIAPLAGAVSASIHLYSALVRGRTLEPLSVQKVDENHYDIRLGPRGKERVLYSDRTDVLRVKGTPRRRGPYDKPGGIIAVLGAGNVASSFELIRALFYDGYVAVHKPHHLNQRTDRVWEKILQPLVDVHALAFVDVSDGRTVITDERLSKIYFTGGTPAAKNIMQSTDTELVSECGGNNPCIIVPGDRPWTKEEIRHQALQIASIVKINGGSICGRVQTFITSKHWSQRRELLDAVALALREQTPAATTYYPGVDKTFEQFRQAYPSARVIQPLDAAPASQTLMIEDIGTEGFGVENEAFCQVMSEVALDVPAHADAFLPAAVQFANDEMLGTLAATVIIDEDTKKAHASTIAVAVTELRYGAIGINQMPPGIWVTPYLTWGGNEEGREFVSGRGNFGNLLGYDNVEKSIVTGRFVSPGHLIIDSKRGWRQFSRDFSRYTVHDSWTRLIRLITGVAAQRFRPADF